MRQVSQRKGVNRNTAMRSGAAPAGGNSCIGAGPRARDLLQGGRRRIRPHPEELASKHNPAELERATQVGGPALIARGAKAVHDSRGETDVCEDRRLLDPVAVRTVRARVVDL